ncbi:MAG TPA: LuxR C-terminal-related transcriptional regulator [Candidatus Baltobacteraceae bacterium]
MKRSRVVALIAAAAASPLTLIVAPAGSGKSRAISEFLAEATGSFDVVDAVDRLDAVERAAAVAAIDRADPTQRWILATRSSEGLPIGSWLAYGRARRVIGVADLSFTASETREEVVAFTGGWAVAASFAHALAESGVELRAVREQTREMMRSFLDERFYGELNDEQRELLEAASVLPAMDVALLEGAGFPDAYGAMQRIAARTAMVWETGAARFACNDITADYLRRRIAMRERGQRAQLYERAASALESSGAIGAALDAYVAAERRDGVVRLLHERGLQLVDRAHVDVVHRAIDALDDKIKREDSVILTLRAVAHAAKGRPVRAEGLLKRALTRAGNDKAAHAAATLRLSLLLANRGEDAGSHLELLAADGDQAAEARAEAWSILAAHRALSGDTPAATSAIQRASELLPSIERDDVRAKVLQRIGVAAINSGDVELARSSLEEAAELAMELELFSLASRAYVSLCRLVLDKDDNVEQHRLYSQSAVVAAKRADNAFDVQTALIVGLRAEMLRGNEDGSCAFEAELKALRTADEARVHAVSSLKAVRMAWNGKFSEAHYILGRTWDRLYLDFDRVMAGALCGLFLAVDGRRTESSRLITDVVRKANGVSANGLFAKRRVAVARLYCAVAESVNGRSLQAATIVRQIAVSDDDPIIGLVTNLAANITTSVRQAATADAELERVALARLMAHGYGDAVRVLEAIRGALEERKFLKRMSITPAEVIVLRHLNHGLSPKEIAARTGRSVFTVRAHIANAIGKLRCNGRAEAVAVARRLGLLD